ALDALRGIPARDGFRHRRTESRERSAYGLLLAYPAQVSFNHHGNEFSEAGLCTPAQLALCLGGVAQQDIHLGRSEITRIYHYMVLIVQADLFEGQRTHIPDRGGLACGYYIVIGLILLQHQPHGFDIVTGKAPVTLGVDIAQTQLLLLAELDARHGVGHLTGDELDASQWGLMVEQDAAGGVQLEAFPVIHGNPVAIELGDPVGAARIERRTFILTLGLDQPEHLAGGGLIEAALRRELPDGFKYMGNSQTINNAGSNRLVPGAADEALRAQIVDFVRAGFDHGTLDRTGIGQVAFNELDIPGDAQLAQPPVGIRAAPGNQSVHSVAFLQQKFCQIGAVLTGNTGNECVLVHCCYHSLFSQSPSTSFSMVVTVMLACQPVSSRSFLQLPATRRCSARRRRSESCFSVISSPARSAICNMSSRILRSVPEQTLDRKSVG